MTLVETPDATRTIQCFAIEKRWLLYIFCEGKNMSLTFLHLIGKIPYGTFLDAVSVQSPFRLESREQESAYHDLHRQSRKQLL